jgi:hypothetical protein
LLASSKGPLDPPSRSTARGEIVTRKAMKTQTISILFALSVFAANMEAVSDENTVISHIPRDRVQSSALAKVGYSKRLHSLEIEFVNGAVYRYLNVPPDVYRDLLGAKSKAHFYDQNIRGKYRSVHVRTRPK